MSKTIIVGVLVALVILTEGLFAWFLIPSTSDVEAWAQAKAAAAQAAESEAADAVHGEGEHGKPGEHGKSTHGHGAEHGSKSSHGEHEHEVDLGKYNIVVHQPMSQVTVRVNFHLIGTVGEKEHEAFETLLAKNQHRLRDHVIFEVRNCQPDDLLDPGLALLKRRILAKSNDLLGQPLLHSIVFSDFAYLDQ
jgi:flagellar FliL protein